MNITRNLFTISDLCNWMDEKSLIINRDYQRSKGLWPLNARSYFIDTILSGFPFPKILIRQTINLKTRKSIREIIDGQQRLMAISDFIHDKLTLTKVSEKYTEQKFSNLDDDTQKKFLSYEISVDTIIGIATDEEVFEVFRRLNSYTVPLNEPEKRHATYQGEFKWFIVELAKSYSHLFESSNILSVRKISRMEDADLLAELCLIIDSSIESKSSIKINALYKKYDACFEKKAEYEIKMTQTMDFIKVNLNRVCEEKVLKKYSFYSLFGALFFNKWGINGYSNRNGLSPIGAFCQDENKAIQNILILFNAVDQGDETDRYGTFVKANKKATNNVGNRLIRLEWLIKALQDKIQID